MRAHRTAPNGRRPTFKGKVWLVIALLSIAVWGVVIWVAVQVFA